MRDDMYTRDVTVEEQALIEKHADKWIPLCSVPDCEKVAGHEGEHGPIEFIQTSA